MDAPIDRRSRRVTLVAAIGENRVMGRGGGLPWHLPADLRHFQRVTMGHVVLMGRRTWDSMGEPLKGRENWVLTRDQAFSAQGVKVFHTLAAALGACRDELQVLGGAHVFEQALPVATHMELTRVHASPAGDTWFPAFDPDDWAEVWRDEHPVDEQNAYACTFLRLQRRSRRPPAWDNAERVSRAKAGRVAPERRVSRDRSIASQRGERVYVVVHEHSEHRRHTRCRA